MKRIIFYISIFFLLVLLVSCGKKQKMHCWNCNETIASSARFCEHCGNALSQDNENGQTFEEWCIENGYGNGVTSPDSSQASQDTSTSDSYVNNTPSSNTQTYTQDNYEYKTTCLSAGCVNLPNSRSSYCSEHACAKSGCSFEKSYSSSFCNMHKCDSVSCDNGRSDSGRYCGEHSCAERGCSNEKGYSYSSVYCSYHECNDVGCTNRKKDYGSYCSEHECADRYCTSQKSVLSDYCFIHDD